MKNDILISGLTVHAENSNVENGSVWIAGEKIREVFVDTKQDIRAQHLEFPAGYHLIPGRIDLHVHGAGGADVMDATPEALNQIRSTLAAEGVTGFLATTLTATPAEIENTLVNLARYQRQNSPTLGAEILGAHLEGPFISPLHIGAHRAELILPPDAKLFDHWQTCASGLVKLVTLAPELPRGIEFIHHLTERGVIASIGHTDANFAVTEVAIAAGARHATHLFNAMRSFHHRDPGCAGAILLDKRVIAELIVDGHHLHPATINLALQMKGIPGLVLVTDGMRAKCCHHEGEFELGGQRVTIKEGAVRLSNGALAGSVLTMTQAVKNMLLFTGCTLSDLIVLTSKNPALVLNIFNQCGSITAGKNADLVVLNENYDVVLTIVRGRIAYGILP